jgi:hypothetical protein
MRYQIIRSISMITLFVAAASVAQVAQAKGTDCEMKFDMKGWSAFYKVSKGTGWITCDNGQKASVKLVAKGGGLVAGKSEIVDGTGKFSDVGDINELFGTYVSGSATAAAGNAASASVVTKGEVSLALAGKGKGIELGIAFGKFVISRE